MKEFIRNFVRRGLVAAGGGPLILALMWLILGNNGTIQTLTVTEAVRSVLSSILLAFIAAGISSIYQAEKLPLPLMIAIHAVTLYLDYLLIYLMNGWLLTDNVWVFTVIFCAGFALIWTGIYFCERKKISELNKRLSE